MTNVHGNQVGVWGRGPKLENEAIFVDFQECPQGLRAAATL